MHCILCSFLPLPILTRENIQAVPTCTLSLLLLLLGSWWLPFALWGCTKLSKPAGLLAR
jgi:hypothetical protein